MLEDLQSSRKRFDLELCKGDLSILNCIDVDARNVVLLGK